MPRKSKIQNTSTGISRERRQATSKKKSEQHQVGIKGTEIRIGRNKRKIKEEEVIPPEVIRTKKALTQIEPPNQSCVLQRILRSAKTRAIDVSQAITSKRILQQKDQHTVSKFNTKNKIPSRGKLKKNESETALPGSNLDVFETVEPKDVVPQKKRKYNRRTTVCDAKTNENTVNSNSRLEINIETEDIKLDEMQSDVRKCKTLQSCSAKSKLNENETRISPSNPNPDILELAILTVQKQTQVTPRVKRKYNTRTKVCDTNTIENDDFLNTVSNSNIDVKESKHSSPIAIIQSDVLKCKTSKVHSSSEDIQELGEVTPQVRRKYNRRTKVCDSKTVKNEDDSLSTVSNSNIDISDALQCKTSKVRSSSEEVQNEEDSLTTVSNSNIDIKESKHSSPVAIIQSDVLKCKTLKVHSSSEDIQELGEVTPQLKRKYNRRTKVCNTKTIKNEDDSLSTVSNSSIDTSEAVQCKISKVRSSSDNVQEQLTPRVKQKYNQTIVSDTKTNQSQSLNSSLEDQDSKDVFAQQKHDAQKCKKLCFDIKDSVTKSASSCSIPGNLGCSSSVVQDGKKNNPHQNAQRCKKQKKVSFAKTCTKYDESPSASSNTDSTESDINLEFLPLITESCKNHIKRILLTAVQFQRHSRRKRLSEADVSKALAFHNDFKVDSEVDGNVEYVMDSESVSDEEESEPLSYHGKWLHQ